MTSLRGHFLIASHALLDTYFEQSVILMIRHDDEGAVGVVINKPLTATVADALGEEIAVAVDEPLRRGGPCEGPMMVIHDRADLDASDEVTRGIYYTHARADIEHVMGETAARALYLVGYAGWGAEQLEREMEEGSWRTIPAAEADIFGPTTDLWSRLSSRAGLLKFLPPDKIPDDPRLN